MCQMQKLPMIQCESAIAIALAKNPMFHTKTKHIDVRYHFTRDCNINWITLINSNYFQELN